MIDREKIIRAVETCFDSWIDRHRDKELDWHEVERMKHDALELLQEQDAVEPQEQEETRTWTVCGNCSQHLISKWLWCPYCGRKVKWDGTNGKTLV